MQKIVLLIAVLVLAGCDQAVHGPWWYATPNKTDVNVGSMDNQVSYRPEPSSNGKARYEVAVIAEDAPMFNPEPGHPDRVVQAREAALQVMGKVCGTSRPTIESEITSNPYGTFYSISCE